MKVNTETDCKVTVLKLWWFTKWRTLWKSNISIVQHHGIGGKIKQMEGKMWCQIKKLTLIKLSPVWNTTICLHQFHSLVFSSTPLLRASLPGWHVFISSVWCSLEKHTGSVTSPPSLLPVAVGGSRARWADFFLLLLSPFFYKLKIVLWCFTADRLW